MKWLARRFIVVGSVIDVKFFVAFKTCAGAFYACYIKNTGSTNIDSTICTVRSEQLMKSKIGTWIIKDNTAMCDLGPLKVGDECLISLDIIGDNSSATLITTTIPALGDPNHGIAGASYHLLENIPEVITIVEMLVYVHELRLTSTALCILIPQWYHQNYLNLISKNSILKHKL